MKDVVPRTIQKTQVNHYQGPIDAKSGIKRYCGNCLSADGFDECTGTGCPLFPVSPYKSEGLPVINSATVTKKALVNKGPHTALSGRV